MARQHGTPNKATAARRTDLIGRIRGRLQDRSAGAASWRELAAAAGVSLSSLTHHFGRRDDVVRAVLEHDRAQGAEPLAVMATPTGDLAASVGEAVAHLADGLVGADLDRMIAAGLAEGLGHPALGPAFLANLLEPMLSAVEERLSAHVARGEMRPDGLRLAAIELASPVIVAVLHQGSLGGSGVRPLEMTSFLEGHAASFVRAWSMDRAWRRERTDGDGRR